MEFAKQYTVIIVTIIALGFVVYQIEWYLEEQDYQRKLAKAEQDYQRQLAEAEEVEQEYQRKLADAKQVKIIGIQWGGGPTGYIGSSMLVRVSLKNFGTNDVYGLSLSIGSDSPEVKPSYTEPVELVEAGSVIAFSSGGWVGGMFVTLWFNDVKLESKQIEY